MDSWAPSASNAYDKSCDLYLVGQLFDDLRFELPTEARKIAGLLKNQELQNCEDALNHEWFGSVGNAYDRGFYRIVTVF